MEKELYEELETLRHRKADERVASETISRLREEKEELRKVILAFIEYCDALEKAYGVKVSNLDDGSAWARVGNAVVAGKEVLKRM